MAIGAIAAANPNPTAAAAQQPQRAEELTTITTTCDKQHRHDQSCPHTVSTRPAPRAGEDGYLLDARA